MLDRLIKLTKDPSAIGRRELLAAVTELYLVEKEPNEAVAGHYASIASRTLQHIGDEDRVAFAQRVAAQPTLPRDVAMQLATDAAAAVAAPVLQSSPVLTDDDLTTVALSNDPERQVAIAQRPDLSTAVTDVLINVGDPDVLRTVSGNDSARFSQSGLKGLLDRSAEDQEILSRLAKRSHEMTPEQVEHLKKIARQSGDAATVRHLQTFTAAKRTGDTEHQLEVKQLIADLRKGLRDKSDTVQLLAYQDRAFELAQVISTLAEIPNVQCLKLLLDPDMTAIASVCLTIGVTPDAFKAVIKLRATRLTHTPYQMEREIETYADITPEAAERTMRTLQGRRSA